MRSLRESSSQVKGLPPPQTHTSAGPSPRFWTLANIVNRNRDPATWLIIFKTSKALIVARWVGTSYLELGQTMQSPLWAAGQCMVTLWDPSSALVLLDTRSNWVDKSSIPLHRESPHLLSFLGSSWKKSEIHVLTLATFCRHVVSNSYLDNVERFFLYSHINADRMWGSLFPFVLGLICDHLPLCPER